MLNIGLDIMGGDYAPQAVLEGCEKAMPLLDSNTRLHLFGQQQIITSFLEKSSLDADRLKVVDAPEVIGMEEQPVRAFQQKRNSSLGLGFGYLEKGAISAFASAGNSGAVMVGAMGSLGTIEGISRPCALGVFPKLNGGVHLLADVGVNTDVRPEMLVDFAQLAIQYATAVLGMEYPKTALLNTGEEESKGNNIYRQAHQLLKANENINFVGNLEPREFYTADVDISVCDGFTGNIFLKQAEAFYDLVRQRGVKDEYLDRFNYEQYGGTPILGLNGNVILGHGVSGAEAIKNMILSTEMIARNRLSEKIKMAIHS